MFFCNSFAESTPGGLPRCYTITKVAKVLSDGPLHPVRRASATTMHWFRSRSRWGSYLALFALAFQLALTFGHVHLDSFTPPSAGKLALGSANASNDVRTAPADPTKPEHRADDRCPICTLIHLAGALTAEPPSLPLPHVSGRLATKTAVTFDFSEPQRALFAARAPPIA
ncbi:MAG: DUF2946 family protein [Xanthobacteraceae bacterium]